MGSYPLPALNVNPPEQNSPFESMGRVASLQGMLQRNKMGKMELDEAMAAKKEQAALQGLFMETQGDMDKLLELAPQRGVRPQTVFKLKAAHIEQKEKVAKMDETTFGNAAKKSGIIGSATGAILSLPPEQRPQALTQALQGLVQQGVIQPQEAQQYAELAKAPPEVMEQQLRMFQTAAVSATNQFDAEAKRREGVAAAQAKREELTAGQKEFADFYKTYLEAGELPKNAKNEMAARQAFKQQATSQLLTPEEEAQKVRIAKAGKPDMGGLAADQSIDPSSQSILAQTGLSYPAYAVLTGQASQLPRDAATRRAAMAEASAWSRKKGVDVATLASQFKAQNEVLAKNISRLNNTQIMEQEILGTVQNLEGLVDPKDLSLRIGQVVKIWAGQEVNDEKAQQYAFHLGQVRNELAAYFAAAQGRTGGDITLQDKHEAEVTIKNGIAGGSLKGLATAVENSTGKMTPIMEASVTRARNAVWKLFGVTPPSGGQPESAGGGIMSPADWLKNKKP